MLLVLFLFPNLKAGKNATVAVYDDEGCWQDGIIAFEKFLNWKRIGHHRISGADIKNGELTNDKYAIVFFPGGMAYDFFKRIGFGGVRKIRDFVNDGGGYLGICAGAYFASDSVTWEGEKIDAVLSLFDGTAVGSLKKIIPWDQYTLTGISVKKNNPSAKYLLPSYSTLYYGGPAFYVHEGVDIDTLATWNGYNDAPAIINFEYGKGRVFLSGAHLEIEENSIRDGQNFAGELDDPETEWDILWAAVDWLLKREITNIPLAVNHHIDTDDYLVTVRNAFIIFSLPASQERIASIDVYNFAGQKVAGEISPQLSSPNTIIILRNGLPVGIYFFIVNTGRKFLTGKFIIQ